MYNLNVNVSSAGTAVSNLLAVESACSTPRTPEILNSLIAMTNPLDNYSFGGEATKVTAGCPQAVSNDSNSSSSTQGEAGATGAPQTTPPSVQHTCSQLIKAGLKLSIESKRKHSADNDDLLDLDLNAKRLKKVDAEDDDGDRSRSPNQGLTPEDEERRRRRRERNKIAATKCRLKKREKTVNLVHESEVLENQNIDLKSQIQELESQRRRLVDMLTMHTPSCMKQGTNPTDRYNQARERFLVTNEDDNQTFSPEGPLPPVTSLSTPVIESSLVYNRPGTVEVGANSFRSQNLDGYSGPIRVISIANENSFTRTNIHYPKAPPTIIVEDECYSPPSQITNLDNNGLSYHYNTQQCHNYNSSNGTNQNYNSTNMDNGCMA